MILNDIRYFEAAIGNAKFSGQGLRRNFKYRTRGFFLFLKYYFKLYKL